MILNLPYVISSTYKKALRNDLRRFKSLWAPLPNTINTNRRLSNGFAGRSDNSCYLIIKNCHQVLYFVTPPLFNQRIFLKQVVVSGLYTPI